jgi:hypothetical protein
MSPPGNSNPFRRRLPAVLSAADWQRIAWAPSYRGPRAADVLHPPPFVPPQTAAEALAAMSADDLVYENGRLVSLSLSGRAFISLAEPLFRASPPREVRLVAVAWYMDELARTPHLAKLERLDLSGNRIGPAGVRELAASPFMAHLTGLNLARNDLGDEGACELLHAPWMGQLRALELAGNGLTDAAVRRVLDRIGTTACVAA